MFDIKENLKKLPDKPGVYLHKDASGQIIYVGKAVSLKNRVRQYFQSSKNKDAKVLAMVSHIEEFEYITTNTEMEALILECNLIKKYMPKYNILLRDDKTFPYIKLTTNEKWPRIIKTRKIYHDGCKYFGPYTDVSAVNNIIDLLNRIYELKRCSTVKFTNDFKPCLNYHINQCKGICAGKVSEEEYKRAIEHVMEFLNGKNKPILDYLNDKMIKASEKLEFEKAAEFRDYILAVKAISEKQRITLLNVGDIDIILAVRGQKEAHIVMFFIKQGKLSGRESYHLQTNPEDPKPYIVSEFIKQYYTENSMIPKEIIVESYLEETELLEQFLSEIRGSAVKIIIPQKGDKKALLDMAKRDVIEMTKTLDEKANREKEKEMSLNSELYHIFGDVLQICHEEYKNNIVNRKHIRIEAYDISNTNGVDSVGAMVVFEGNKPIKKDYRRFKIRTVEGPNDYGSLQEILYRRFKRSLLGDKGFSKMPDLILMDGGKAQVSVAKQTLDALKINIPVAGMVKDDKHRTRGLIYNDKEIDLKGNNILFKYFTIIQDEVHRFAIEYHQGLRNKSIRISELDKIEGIGEKRRNELLRYFGSIETIKEASIEALEEVPTMTKLSAKKVHEYFH
ncbi:excinuclease ABC subunit UvrC [Anaerovorax odorimutans]|uniref:excinuclease ABC subunit UvrC n=1 Tax=Anaerovorax odorimutans TaxID=109327 RepID=UPI0003F6AA63|nr:excinuclease ABC subunit UvrC [Anaerovorax odorimutans]